MAYDGALVCKSKLDKPLDAPVEITPCKQA